MIIHNILSSERSPNIIWIFSTPNFNVLFVRRKPILNRNPIRLGEFFDGFIKTFSSIIFIRSDIGTSIPIGYTFLYQLYYFLLIHSYKLKYSRICSPVMRYTSDIRQSLIGLSHALIYSSLQLPSATRSTASSDPVAKPTLKSSFSSSLSPFPSKAIFRAICNSS